MSEDQDEDNNEVVARGPDEKYKLKKSLLKKQNDGINNFFNEFRNSCRNSNRRDALLMVLYHELDKTLKPLEKEFLIKRWKPVNEPLILVSSIDQLQDIKNYIESRDFSSVSVAQQKPIFDVLKPQSCIMGTNYSQETFNINDNQNNTNNYQYSILMSTANIENETLSEDPYNLIARTTINENNSSDLPQDELESENDEDSSQSIMGNGCHSEDTFNGSTLVQKLAYDLSGIIERKGDVMSALDSILRSPNANIYGEVLLYNDNLHEPILFQLSLNIDKYEFVLDALHKQGFLKINHKNMCQISVFSFLFIKNVEVLYEFLKFLKGKKLQEEVKSECSNDFYFKNALFQKKRETIGDSGKLRIRLESIEKFCITNKEN